MWRSVVAVAGFRPFGFLFVFDFVNPYNNNNIMKTINQKRIEFWKKLKSEGRSFAWFYRKYLSDCKLKYNTLYKQSIGQELTGMAIELEESIDKFIGE